jgi:RNA polymerase sigma-70 factor (sigma-E family)
VFFRRPSREVPDARLGERIADALRAACHPDGGLSSSVSTVTLTLSPGWLGTILGWSSPAGTLLTVPVRDEALAAVDVETLDADRLVATMFEREARSLVRLARLFVDDRNAAEDLVQEAFIRFARATDRLEDPAKAAAYLRSIVLNLARDHNRRGLVSLRHHLPFDPAAALLEDEISLRDDQRRVIDALRGLPRRQRDCVVLRYYSELGIEAIAETLGVSPNSVKTHLRRGMDTLERTLTTAEGDQ